MTAPEGTVVKFRRQPWTKDEVIEVTLTPAPYGSDEWRVFHDGKFIGTVGKYQGTLDRPISRGSRIVTRGKRRTLWHYASPRPEKGEYAVGRALFDQYSRADCLRSLIQRTTW